nr:MAG TPA: hypothetical protein [Caudoviricetes sp.]
MTNRRICGTIIYGKALKYFKKEGIVLFAKIVLIGFLGLCVLCTIGVICIFHVDIKNEQKQDKDWHK